MVTHLDLHPALRGPISIQTRHCGTEHPETLLDRIPESPETLLALANRHVVSARQFDLSTILQVCRLAAALEAGPRLMRLPLNGKIMITAFYEPSTRTRLSFESAWHRLGGDILSITDADTTGLAKGESLQDVAEMFSNYGDVIVLRDRSQSSVYSMIETLRVPIINAGNGIDEHPTQALADIYALLKWRPELCRPNECAPVRVGIIGTPGRMRTVRSLLLLLSQFADALEPIQVINPDPDVFDAEQREQLEALGLRFRVVSSLRDALPALDVVYINSIAWIGDTFERLTGDMRLTAESPLKDGSIVLHPLARGSELDASLDATDHNWYFAQARGATFVRMALLTSLTQRVHRVADVRPQD